MLSFQGTSKRPLLDMPFDTLIIKGKKKKDQDEYDKKRKKNQQCAVLFHVHIFIPSFKLFGVLSNARVHRSGK